MPAGTSFVSSSSSGSAVTRFFGKLKTGLKLSKDSLGVIQDHPKLLLFPLFGGLATLLFWIAFLVPLWISGVIGTGAEFAVLFLLYFLTTFTATFFTASLVFAVNQAFHGEEPQLGESMRAAWRRKGPILVWSVIAATVSLILKKAQESNNLISRLLASFFALGWTVLTFFIVPVIVFEDVTVRSMFTRSGETFRSTWGESIGVSFGVTIIQFGLALVGILIALVIAALFWLIMPAAGIVVGIFLIGGVLVGSYLIGQTVWGITKTALYVYAAEDRVPEQFADFDFATLDGRTDGATPGNIQNPPRHL